MSDTYLPNGLPTPSPLPDGLSAPYWEGTRRRKLLIQKCGGCGAWQWGPEWICHRCHSFDLEVGGDRGQGAHLLLSAAASCGAWRAERAWAVFGRAGRVAGVREHPDGRQPSGRSRAGGDDRGGGGGGVRAARSGRSALYAGAVALGLRARRQPRTPPGLVPRHPASCLGHAFGTTGRPQWPRGPHPPVLATAHHGMRVQGPGSHALGCQGTAGSRGRRPPGGVRGESPALPRARHEHVPDPPHRPDRLRMRRILLDLPPADGRSAGRWPDRTPRPPDGSSSPAANPATTAGWHSPRTASAG